MTPISLQERNTAVKEALKGNRCKGLNNELDYYLELDDDEDRPRDLYRALYSAEQFADENGDRNVLKAARKVLISLGVYRVVSDSEYSKTVVFPANRKRALFFKIDGVRYRFYRHLPPVDNTEGRQP